MKPTDTILRSTYCELLILYTYCKMSYWYYTHTVEWATDTIHTASYWAWKLLVTTAHLGQVGGVDASGDTSSRHHTHVGNKPLRRIETDDVDAAVGSETDRHKALAEPISETVTWNGIKKKRSSRGPISEQRRRDTLTDNINNIARTRQMKRQKTVIPRTN